jgi:UDP-N-acetylmuramate--alanine ligase
MSAIARLLLAAGERVYGSDVRRTPLIEALVREGAQVTVGHRAENVGDVGLLVVSSAIRPDNPEYLAAQQRQIPIVVRGEMLARIIGPRQTLAIAGTHGKTTTTAMAASIFEKAGFDPTIAVGGERIDTHSNARAGAGPWFITEADESDGTFLALSPTIAVVTNIENDHIANDTEMAGLIDQFITFLGKVPEGGSSVVGIDNRHSAALAAKLQAPNLRTFATRDPAAAYYARNIRYDGFGSRFELIEHGESLGGIDLRVPGEINVMNALAAAAAARAATVDFASIAHALAGFGGVRRRFEVVGRSERMTVIDDYAHHPTAVGQTIAAARRVTDAKIVVAFQPHRFTRTQYLAADFARALAGADCVYLTPVYAAAEDPIPGVSERSIGDPLAAAGTDVRYVADVEALATTLAADAPPGALVLMLGAGSISNVAHRLGEAIDAARAVAP